MAITLRSVKGSALTYAELDANFTSCASSAGDDTSTNATYYPTVATSSGGVSIKTSSTKMYFNPSTGTLSATIINSLSDENFKTNIISLEDALDIVNQMSGYSFDWKDGSGSSYGVIAQEIEEIIPDAVVEDEGKKSVNYASITPFLIEAIKTLTEQITLLQAEVADLKNQTVI